MPDTKFESEPSAPLEKTFTKDQLYDLDYGLKAVKQEALSFSMPVIEIVSGKLQGCGPVDLVHLKMRYKCTAAGQSVTLALSNISASHSPDELFSLQDCYTATSNNFNYGQTVNVDLVVPDRFTRQIQPPSTNAPSFRLYLEKDAGVELTIFIGLKIHGARRIYGSFPVPGKTLSESDD